MEHRRRYSAFKLAIIVEILATDQLQLSRDVVKLTVPAFLVIPDLPQIGCIL